VAVWFGGLAFSFPIASMLTSDPAGRLSIKARSLGVDLVRSRTSLQLRIGFIALALGLGPTIWMMALGYMKQLDAHAQRATIYGRWAAQVAADEFSTTGRLEARGPQPNAEFLVHRALIPNGRLDDAPPWLSGGARTWLDEQPAEARSG